MKKAREFRLPVWECDSCGACCKHLIIECDHLDVLRAPEIATRGTLMDGHGKMTLPEASWSLNDRTKGSSGACVFLDKGSNLCSIYAKRPGVCVNMQAGSRQCQEARESAGLVPLAPMTFREPTIVDRIAALARNGEDE